MFQDYQVLNLLGRGGFACVYRAKSIITGQEVAIKMVRHLWFYLIDIFLDIVQVYCWRIYII